ncbi:MAG TPA: hypothetical protein VFU81_03540, partial [Thermomicrobiales bacterium]|nr:hypothetical protein [Thermomicrobiales bacterium]
LATGDRAATTIERVGSTRPAPGVVIEGAPPRQERTEAFRFASGRIVEYWSALDDTAFARSLPPLSMPLPAGMKQAALVRFALPPGAVLADLSEPGPELLLPETGAVTVAVDESAELARAGAIAEGWRPATAKQELTLGPGDALLVPAGAHRAIRNETSAGATMLGLLIYSLADISGVRHPPPLTALYATTPYGRSVPIDGATAMLLERGTDGCAACRDGTLRVVWAPLAPGQHLAVEPNAGLSFLATEAGAVATGDRRFGPATGTLDAPTAGETAEARVVAAGAAVAVPSGGSVSFATAANAGASLLLIDIGMPVPDAAISPSGA